MTELTLSFYNSKKTISGNILAATISSLSYITRARGTEIFQVCSGISHVLDEEIPFTCPYLLHDDHEYMYIYVSREGGDRRNIRRGVTVWGVRHIIMLYACDVARDTVSCKV